MGRRPCAGKGELGDVEQQCAGGVVIRLRNREFRVDIARPRELLVRTAGMGTESDQLDAVWGRLVRW